MKNWKWHLLLWVVTASILSTASYMHSRNPGFDHFSRAGCLLVVVGMFSGFITILRTRVLVQSVRLRHAFAKKGLKRRYKNNDEEYKQRLLELENNFEKHLERERETVEFELGVEEFLLLILGTVLWGFGDLI